MQSQTKPFFETKITLYALGTVAALLMFEMQIARADSSCPQIGDFFNENRIVDELIVPSNCVINLGDNPVIYGPIINYGEVKVGLGTWKINGDFVQELGAKITIYAETINVSTGQLALKGSSLPQDLKQLAASNNKQQIDLRVGSNSCDQVTISGASILRKDTSSPWIISSECLVESLPIFPKLDVVVHKLPGETKNLNWLSGLYAFLSLPFASPLTPALGNLAFLANGPSEILLLVIRSLNNILVLLGLRRRSQYWGTVYDSQSKQPLDPVIVRLINPNTKEVLAQAISDLFGRYGFFIKPGEFILHAEKKGYTFPSKISLGSKDQIFDNLYHGEIIKITDPSEVVAPNIPMDSLGYDFNQEAKKKIIKFHPIWEWVVYVGRIILFTFGFLLALISSFYHPSIFNFVILAIYIALTLYQIFWPKKRLWGRVISKITRQPLQDIQLQLSYPQMPGISLGRAETGADGKYFLKANPGKYLLKITPLNNESQVLLTKEVEITEQGIVNSFFELPIS